MSENFDAYTKQWHAYSVSYSFEFRFEDAYTFVPKVSENKFISREYATFSEKPKIARIAILRTNDAFHNSVTDSLSYIIDEIVNPAIDIRLIESNLVKYYIINI